MVLVYRALITRAVKCFSHIFTDETVCILIKWLSLLILFNCSSNLCNGAGGILRSSLSFSCGSCLLPVLVTFVAGTTHHTQPIVHNPSGSCLLPVSVTFFAGTTHHTQPIIHNPSYTSRRKNSLPSLVVSEVLVCVWQSLRQKYGRRDWG